MQYCESYHLGVNGIRLVLVRLPTSPGPGCSTRAARRSCRNRFLLQPTHLVGGSGSLLQTQTGRTPSTCSSRCTSPLSSGPTCGSCPQTSTCTIRAAWPWPRRDAGQLAHGSQSMHTHCQVCTQLIFYQCNTSLAFWSRCVYLDSIAQGEGSAIHALHIN